MNPEVHAKLRRLEDENETLRKRLSDESEERLRQLKSDLDDSKRLAEAFRKKYRDAVRGAHLFPHSVTQSTHSLEHTGTKRRRLGDGVETYVRKIEIRGDVA